MDFASSFQKTTSHRSLILYLERLAAIQLRTSFFDKTNAVFPILHVSKAMSKRQCPHTPESFSGFTVIYIESAVLPVEFSRDSVRVKCLQT